MLLTVGEFWNGVDVLDVIEDDAPVGSDLYMATVPVDDGNGATREVFFHADNYVVAHRAAVLAFGKNSGFVVDLA